MNNSKDNVKVNDSLMGLVIAVLGAVYLGFAVSLKDAAIGGANQPKYFPLMVAGLLIILGIKFMFSGGIGNIAKAAGNFKDSFVADKSTNMTIALTCVGSIVYALIFDRAGFVIATFLFLELLLFLTRKEKIIANTVIAAIFSVTIYLVFSKLLGVILPPMPFVNF